MNILGIFGWIVSVCEKLLCVNVFRLRLLYNILCLYKSCVCLLLVKVWLVRICFICVRIIFCCKVGCNGIVRILFLCQEVLLYFVSVSVVVMKY